MTGGGPGRAQFFDGGREKRGGKAEMLEPVQSRRKNL